MSNNPNENRSGDGRSPKAATAASRVLLDTRSKNTAKTAAGSALTQRPNKTSATSERIIKETSLTHRDALKRLVDR